MTWLDNFDTAALRRETERAMRLPLGLASPLWLAFGAAAGAGVAWWWMSRMGRPFNIEAKMGSALAAPEGRLDVSPGKATKAPVIEETVLDVAPSDPAPVEAAPLEPAPLEPAPVVLADDDLTLLVGVGPKLATALAEKGVTRFAQMAAWTEDELAAIDTALNLRGRAHRDKWIAQAKAFIEKA
jgi:predicted flap endonuclease-1-like 5' DNA nuclease